MRRAALGHCGGHAGQGVVKRDRSVPVGRRLRLGLCEEHCTAEWIHDNTPSSSSTVACLLTLHKDRLDASWTPLEMDKIGLQFSALCTSYRNDDAIKAAIDAHDQTSAFDAAWATSALDDRFDYLASFIGGLTSPLFPNTALFESDFFSLEVPQNL